jgi:hypothetical protein
LSALCGFSDIARFQAAHRRWVEQALLDGAEARDPCWSEAIAVGSKGFVEKIQVELGLKAKYRDVSEAAGAYTLREPATPYRPIFESKNDVLSLKNAVYWDRTIESTEA